MADSENSKLADRAILDRLREESMGYFRRSMYRRFRAKMLPFEIDGVIDEVLAAMHPSVDHLRMKRDVVRRLKERSSTEE